MKKILLCIGSALLLTGCTAATYGNAAVEEGNIAADAVCETSGNAEQAAAVYAACENGSGGMPESDTWELMYEPYRKFGMAYDKDRNTLTYEGEYVRWFEDYYPVGDGGYAGADFFNKAGTIDVYAERDFSKTTVSSDGSYDPGGELTGLKKFSQEEFDKRDIDPLLHPKTPEATAVTDDESEAGTSLETAAEYAPFGITYYDTPNGGWYYKGEKIRSFRDVLTSNGEAMNSGKFEGVLRCFGSEAGTVSLAAVRDYSHPDAEGNGTLTGVEVLEDTSSGEIILHESPSNTP